MTSQHIAVVSMYLINAIVNKVSYKYILNICKHLLRLSNTRMSRPLIFLHDLKFDLNGMSYGTRCLHY